MIYVVRHGQTDMNIEERWHGRNGRPLNGVGRKQAERLKEKLAKIKFNQVFSSPQERAIQTAEIATGIAPIIDSRLDVFDLGEADGLKKEEVQVVGGIPDPTLYKGMEDTRTFFERVFSFMKELESKDEIHGQNILIAGHKCTTGCIGAFFKGMPEDQNILKLASDNGEFKTYSFKQRAESI